MRRLLTQDETREILAPHEEALRDSVTEGVERWQAAPPDLSASCGPVARAGVVHDLICEAVRNRFLGVDGVSVRQEAGTTFLLFADRLAVRFKKVDADLRCSTSHTRRQQEIHSQQLVLDGTDQEVTWATAGYELDEAGELVRAVIAVHQDDRLHYWFHLASAAVADPLALPLAYDDDDLDIRPAASDDDEQTGTGEAQ